MTLSVIAVIIIALIVLNWLRLPFIAWLFIWPAAVYALIRWGIQPLVPSSVLGIYVSLTAIGLIAYLFADSQRLADVQKQVVTFMVDRRFSAALALVVILIPIALAAKIYFDSTRELRAPTFARTIHPAPPNDLSFKGKQISLITAKNPYRELETKDPAQFKEHVAKGKVVYYRNCVYCHGDDLAGDGIFAHGFNPVPANLNSPTTLAILQESYLFWRIAKGGPGLPEESGPWSSSMPAWEKFLSEDEIWDVILFLYDYTGMKPRAEEEGHH